MRSRPLTAATVLVLAVLVGRMPPADAQAEKPPSTKEIMGKLNKGPNSLCPVIGKELKADPVNWDDVQKQAKDFAGLAEALTKAKPNRGAAENWTKLTTTYAADAKELDAAAEKKDQAAAAEAHKKLAASCAACHKEHR